MGRGLYTDHRAIEPREGGEKGGREEAGREGKEKDLGSGKMRGREGRIKGGRKREVGRDQAPSLLPTRRGERERRKEEGSLDHWIYSYRPPAPQR